MAGTRDDWIHVTFTPDATPETAATAGAGTSRRRRWPLVAATAAVAVAVAGGALAYGDARKTVSLDVDGNVRTVTTMADSVDALLETQGVQVGERDLVAPAATSDLSEDADVVVRTGKQLDLQVDGKQTDAWVTALDADEALDTLTARGGDVRIIASRSGERTSLPVDLDTNGPVAVVHDGDAQIVDGAEDVAGALNEADVAIDGDDRVHVTATSHPEVKKDVVTAEKKAEKQAAQQAPKTEQAAAKTAKTEQAADEAAPSQVAVVVERVETKNVTTKKDVGHETTTKKSGDRYSDLDAKVAREGADGVRTVVRKVTTVDGDVVKKKKVSDKVTKKPVTEVLVEGTKERPEPEPETASLSGSTREIGQQLAAARGWTGSEWSCLESLWTKESGWDASAANPSSSAYGIPQALPGSKMATAGADWQSNPATQIKWGLGYIDGRYGTPCGAWGHSQSVGWY